MKNEKKLTLQQSEALLKKMEIRFGENKNRYKDIDWNDIKIRLENKPEKLWSLHQMEETGGEPDVVGFDDSTKEYLIFDCAEESPKGRRSLCYDREAREARKKHPPKNSAMELAKEMGIDLLSESQYRKLQELGDFDTKTSSWLKTPIEIRKLGGSIFGDFRFNTVFVYHNGADSYYASRGFRGVLRV